MDEAVHFVLVSDRDKKLMRVASEAPSWFKVEKLWLGSLDTSRYFTSEPRILYDPTKKPWFVVRVSWLDAAPRRRMDDYSSSHIENIATNNEEWTYVKQSLGGTRILITDKVKAAVNEAIEKFWRKS